MNRQRSTGAERPAGIRSGIDRALEAWATLPKVLTALSLLIGAIVALIGGIVATDRINPGPGSEKLGYEILVTQPALQGAFSDLLKIEGDVLGGLGDRRAWLFLEPNDGLGNISVLGEIEPDQRSDLGGRWQVTKQVDFTQEKSNETFTLSIYIADGSASKFLESVGEGVWPKTNMPSGAGLYTEIELVREPGTQQ